MLQFYASPPRPGNNGLDFRLAWAAGGIYTSIAALGDEAKKETPAQLVVVQGFSWSGR